MPNLLSLLVVVAALGAVLVAAGLWRRVPALSVTGALAVAVAVGAALSAVALA